MAGVFTQQPRQPSNVSEHPHEGDRPNTLLEVDARVGGGAGHSRSAYAAGSPLSALRTSRIFTMSNGRDLRCRGWRCVLGDERPCSPCDRRGRQDPLPSCHHDGLGPRRALPLRAVPRRTERCVRAGAEAVPAWGCAQFAGSRGPRAADRARQPALAPRRGDRATIGGRSSRSDAVAEPRPVDGAPLAAQALPRRAAQPWFLSNARQRIQASDLRLHNADGPGSPVGSSRCRRAPRSPRRTRFAGSPD